MRFDPLLFLCKQAAGDFNAVLSASGYTVKELSEEFLTIKSAWDRSSKFVIKRITGEAPEKTELLFRHRGELVHYVPEAQKFSTESVRGIVVMDMTKFNIHALNATKQKEPVYVRLEGDLYGAQEFV